MSLVEPKPHKSVWVRSMIHWLIEPAHLWANYLTNIKHPCLRDSTRFSEMLNLLLQALQKEKKNRKILEGLKPAWTHLKLTASNEKIPPEADRATSIPELTAEAERAASITELMPEVKRAASITEIMPEVTKATFKCHAPA